MKRPFAIAVLALLAACSDQSGYALGTLERDRITLPAPVAERIAEVAVREGQTVAAGELLLVLEPERTAAREHAAQAELARAQAALDEARAGPRIESIAEAQARLRGAEGIALNARHEFERVQALVNRQMLPRADLDRSRANVVATAATVQAAREALAALQNGTRSEQVAQAEAAVAAAQANVDALQVDLARTRITAPRAGQVDSLPFEPGDQVPVGTPLAVLLVGEHPYARVYVPEALRANIAIGTPAQVRVHATDRVYAGRVRMIRSEPSFTPYYALAGEDASRLSWLAEIELDADAADLPVGLPLRAEFAATSAAAPEAAR
jgi:HlyD family secretion protein